MAAAETLQLELLKDKAFSSVALHSKLGTNDPAAFLEFARLKKYDLLITGDLIYYLDGGFSIPSRVDEPVLLLPDHRSASAFAIFTFSSSAFTSSQPGAREAQRSSWQGASRTRGRGRSTRSVRQGASLENSTSSSGSLLFGDVSSPLQDADSFP